MVRIENWAVMNVAWALRDRHAPHILMGKGQRKPQRIKAEHYKTYLLVVLVMVLLVVLVVIYQLLVLGMQMLMEWIARLYFLVWSNPVSILAVLLFTVGGQARDNGWRRGWLSL